MPPEQTPGTPAQTAQPDVSAIQAEAAGYRQLAAHFLGREIKPDENPGAISAQIQAEREAKARRTVEVENAVLRGLFSQGLQCQDLDYLQFKLNKTPELSALVEKSDWQGVMGKALEMGLVSKPTVQATAPPALPPQTIVRPGQAAASATPDPWGHIANKNDAKKLTASELMLMQQQNPEKFKALTR